MLITIIHHQFKLNRDSFVLVPELAGCSFVRSREGGRGTRAGFIIQKQVAAMYHSPARQKEINGSGDGEEGKRHLPAIINNADKLVLN